MIELLCSRPRRVPVVGALCLTMARGHLATSVDINGRVQPGLADVRVVYRPRHRRRRTIFVFGTEMFFIDSLNVFFRVADRLRRLTTSIFSRPVHEEQAGARPSQRAAPAPLQRHVSSCSCSAMLPALTTNDLGVLSVAMEAATLTTVLLVSLYRTPAFARSGVEIFHPLRASASPRRCSAPSCCLFAAERVLGETGNTLLWTHLVEVKGRARADHHRAVLIFLLVGYSCKVGLAPYRDFGPTPTPKARRQSSRGCFPACCSTSRSTPSSAARSSPTAPFPGRASPAT